MNQGNMKLIKQLQVTLCMLLLVFSTLGCNVKQSLFSSLDITTEIPVTGSKSIRTTSIGSCNVLNERQASSHSFSQKKTIIHSFNPLSAYKTVLAYIPQKQIIRNGFLLDLVGTSPPLYLIHQNIKIALS